MKYCPQCKAEYEAWVKSCSDCKTELVNELPPVKEQGPVHVNSKCRRSGGTITDASHQRNDARKKRILKALIFGGLLFIVTQLAFISYHSFFLRSTHGFITSESPYAYLAYVYNFFSLICRPFSTLMYRPVDYLVGFLFKNPVMWAKYPLIFRMGIDLIGWVIVSWVIQHVKSKQ